jgi:cytochrome P450
MCKFPGPKLAGATDIVAAYYAARGQRSKYSERLHATYGPVVRTKPNELSFIGEDAWKDIYMHRQGRKQMIKADRIAGRGLSIIVAPDDAHARQRRLLSHAFSDRAASFE